MRLYAINHGSGIAAVALSLVALATVLFGYTREPLPDEGALAHIFQLTVVAAVGMIIVASATAGSTEPRRTGRRVVVAIIALALAFAALYYLENDYYPTRPGAR